MPTSLRSLFSVAAVPAAVVVPVFTHGARWASAVSLLSTALTTGMSFAHAIELTGKRAYDGALWWHLASTLYRPWWGRAGHLEGVALLAVPTTAVLQRNRRPAGPLTAAAAGCLLLNPGIFWGYVRPTNLATFRATPEELPADWRELRDRWEYGHLARFVLHLLALLGFSGATLAQPPDVRPGRCMGRARGIS